MHVTNAEHHSFPMLQSDGTHRRKKFIGLRLLAFILAALPAAFALYLIFRFGTNMPFWDEWFPDMAGIYIKAHQHQLTFTDFAAQHNEHRILIPRLVYFVLNSLTRWNTIVEMVAGWCV